jgi:hypothetical protein
LRCGVGREEFLNGVVAEKYATKKPRHFRCRRRI